MFREIFCFSLGLPFCHFHRIGTQKHFGSSNLPPVIYNSSSHFWEICFIFLSIIYSSYSSVVAVVTFNVTSSTYPVPTVVTLEVPITKSRSAPMHIDEIALNIIFKCASHIVGPLRCLGQCHITSVCLLFLYFVLKYHVWF